MDAEPSPTSPTASRGLLDLPSELLEAIFREHDKTYRPICKALHPVQHRQFYRSLEIFDYTTLASFCRAAPGISGLADNVVSLTLWFSDESNSEQDRVEYELAYRIGAGLPVDDLDGLVHPDARTCPTALFNSLLDQLKNLRDLTLSLVEDDYVDTFLGGEEVTSAVGLPRLQRLESLSVDFMCDGAYREPERMHAWVRKLERLPNLRNLELTQDDTPIVTTPMPPPIPSFPSLRSLRLRDGNLHPWNGVALSRLAPNLDRLVLDDAPLDGQVAAILDAAPTHLRRLDLCPCATRGKLNLHNVLRRFPHLEHLRLEQDSFDAARLLPYLRSLPNLHTLEFGLDAPVTDTLLAAIVDGPERLPSLRHLVLDHVLVRRGDSLADRDYCLESDFEASGFELSDDWDWTRPAFPQGASEAGLRAALRSAEALGIVVEGSALEALEWDEAYAQARDSARLLWAAEADRWDRAREFVGEERAEAYRLGYEAGRGAR